jgi:hypothetical protein
MEAEDEPESRLERQIEQGHRRADSAAPGGPEWDAAQANLDDLEHRMHALRPLPSVEGLHVLSRLGPMVLEDDCLIHGTIAAIGPAGEDLRVTISEVPDRVHSRHEFLHELSVLADRAGFVVEIEGNEGELSFYAWDRELRDSEVGAAG